MSRKSVLKAIGSENVDVKGAGAGGGGDGTVKPAVRVVGGENAPLRVIPPFLKEREGMIRCGSDDLQAVRGYRKVEVLGGCVEGGVARERREEVRKGGVVLVEKCDSPSV